jgi:hypothetical protein
MQESIMGGFLIFLHSFDAPLPSFIYTSGGFWLGVWRTCLCGESVGECGECGERVSVVSE